MIYHKKLYLIDFGLGFHSDSPEDKATDLHVLKEALEARHPKIQEKVIPLILQAYSKTSKHAKPILKQLESLLNTIVSGWLIGMMTMVCSLSLIVGVYLVTWSFRLFWNTYRD
jgi:hypothetical protein